MSSISVRTTHRSSATADDLHHTTARRVARTVLVAVVLALGVLLAPNAWAHTELVSATPADGSTVTTAPHRVVLTFDEAVGEVGDAIVVTAPGGGRVDDGPTQVDGARVSVGLERLTEAGEYTVAFRVVSDDGHPVTDTLTFTYQPPTGGTTTTTPGTSGASSPATTTAAGDAGTGSGDATPWIVIAVVAVIIVVVTWVLVRRRRA
jgi:copper resistance protein C